MSFTYNTEMGPCIFCEKKPCFNQRKQCFVQFSVERETDQMKFHEHILKVSWYQNKRGKENFKKYNDVLTKDA